MVLQQCIVFICSKTCLNLCSAFIDQEFDLLSTLNRYFFEILNIISKSKRKLLKILVKSLKYAIPQLNIHEIDN